MGDAEANEDSRRRGIFDCEEAYRTPTSLDYKNLFESGMVVLDTNVLINLYRSNERTRRDTFAVLHRLRERLWIPHQVLSEFWRNRDLPSVKGHHRAKARTACTALDKALRSLSDATDRWLKDVHLATDDEAKGNIKKYTDRIEASVEGVKQYIERQAENDALEGTDSTHTDPVLVQLDPLLLGRIGPPMAPETYMEALAEAKRRAVEKIPPGYADYASKPDDQAAGDYIIWKQVIGEATRTRNDVLLITGDVKEDWWTPRAGRSLARPRMELQSEMRKEAGVALFMMTPSQLLAEASSAFRLKVDERSVSDLASREGAIEIEAFPAELRNAILEGIKAAHVRASAVHQVSGLKTRSPYGVTMSQSVTEELTERISDIGGDVLDVHGVPYPIFGDLLLIPMRTSPGHTTTRMLSSQRLKRIGSVINATRDMLNFNEIPLANLTPVAVCYSSTPDSGVDFVYAVMGNFGADGNFDVALRFGLL
ncbi:PIN-like domain-containing protein [Streptomyces sp. SRF1]|uniref:PIN-like domain-containing protein n=1 Tax=Streptomyces sp. SRF1 TaxID=1549642 RepID=UPI0025AF5244|nr:PIN-like domain-containing protein [Streptomyces sp. SRF1]MDN3053110.1 PIN-like domain-containing protein [Streptomyces sp. SRF1]